MMQAKYATADLEAQAKNSVKPTLFPIGKGVGDFFVFIFVKFFRLIAEISEKTLDKPTHNIYNE